MPPLVRPGLMDAMSSRLLKRRDTADKRSDEHTRRLIDDAWDAYADWRQESMSVVDAYGRWASSPAADAGLAFAAYVAALDREEQAERSYANLIRRVRRLVAAEGYPGWGAKT